MLLVRKPDARDPSTYRDFRVRKPKVLRFLQFLKANNPFYAHIDIRHPDDIDLPIDGNILDHLPIVDTIDSRVSSNLQNTSHEPFRDPGEENFEPEELIQEQNCFLPSPVFGQSELEAVSSAMRSNGLASTPGNEVAISWPTLGDPLSEFSTEGLFSKAFPALFPLGMGDFSLPRRRSLALYEWVKHLMRYRDPRFATHPRFRFFALNLIYRHRAMRQGRFLFSRNISHNNMTVGQLREALRGQDGLELASKIVRCLKSVRGTRPYWFVEGGKLQDMIEQLGTPTLFYTLSMADLYWPDLHRLMPDDPFRDGLTSRQSFLIRSRNIANNPHIVSSYLSIKHHYLKETVLQHLDTSENTRISDFWFRVEWQARGSGTVCLTCYIF